MAAELFEALQREQIEQLAIAPQKNEIEQIQEDGAWPLNVEIALDRTPYITFVTAIADNGESLEWETNLMLRQLSGVIPGMPLRPLIWAFSASENSREDICAVAADLALAQPMPDDRFLMQAFLLYEQLREVGIILPTFDPNQLVRNRDVNSELTDVVGVLNVPNMRFQQPFEKILQGIDKAGNYYCFDTEDLYALLAFSFVNMGKVPPIEIIHDYIINQQHRDALNANIYGGIHSFARQYYLTLAERVSNKQIGDDILENRTNAFKPDTDEE